MMLKAAEYKDPQHNLKTEKFLSAEKLYLPLSQHTGKPSKVCVQENQIVQKNQIIAESNGFISASLHAPIKAKVSKIKKHFHPKFGKTKTIVLSAQPEHKPDGHPNQTAGLDQFRKDQLLTAIAKAGIVGMGGAGFPAQVKLNPPKGIDTLIINGCECEPYLASDCRLMIENLKGIFKGIEIISKLVAPEKIIFAVEENKKEAIKKINFFLHRKKNNSKIELRVLKSRYPQGGEKQLIYSLTKRKISGKMLPFDLGCIVNNVATCFAVYEAVYFNQPLTRRIVTFCGDALVEPKNLWVNIGTTLAELIEKEIIKFKKNPKKIIFGGPMMGDAVTNLANPILKTTSGVLFLEKLPKKEEESACIRCGRCVNYCPINLIPLEYAKMVKKEKYQELKDYYIKDCIECGCCSYVCPAQIPILDYIKLGKEKIK
ncbi:MAG: electron transport complex subunit RsxC [Candidatus Omnitrophica bacterium]|nr:electron transport complex subunit RsxC [Candidatus Omnitrophota bacterium]MCF7877452.1 electron transport complex subunit RsxC [Candidatus Omnitrophota bacterium]MCF7878045.1 electron transport complex subunit RsxC [Candidatus Omnitrophota bacterium]MCF7892726.1 electron transport complex subunit RsxC [Candidatus Omnitrophota bacterium]